MFEARRLVEKLWSYCNVLRDDGVYAVWSEKPSRPFERVLARAGFAVSARRGERGASIHWVYLARPAPPGNRP